MNEHIKTNMKKLFGTYKTLKDGKQGKTIVYPHIIKMHTDEDLIDKWVYYATLDAEATYFLYYVMKNELVSFEVNRDGKKLANIKNMFDL